MAVNILDKLNKIPLYYKVIALVVLAGAMVVSFHYLYWAPLDAKIVELQGQLQSLDRTLKEQQAIANDLVTFQQNTRKLEEDLKIALRQLPREKEIPSLLRDIYTLGKKSGVEFKTFQPGGQVAKKLYAEVPIKLNFVGNFHEVAVFFDRIGKLSRIVNVSDLDLGGSQSKDTGTELNVNCTAMTFMFTGGGGI